MEFDGKQKDLRRAIQLSSDASSVGIKTEMIGDVARFLLTFSFTELHRDKVHIPRNSPRVSSSAIFNVFIESCYPQHSPL